MKIKDHFLSQETFEIKASKYEGILKTAPMPSPEDLTRYYDSNAYISHQTKVSSLKDFIYQSVKSHMLERKKKWIHKYKDHGKILDIGAGTGDFLNGFDNEKWEKFALEPSTKLHKVLIQKGITLVEKLSEFDNDSFDVITLWHSLEHIPDIEDTLSNLKRIIKNEGTIFIAVPNHKSYDARYYKNFWAAWDVPRHLWHFSRNGLKDFIQKYAFHCLEEKGLVFDAFYVSLLSEKYKPNGFLPRGIYTGFISNLKAKRTKEFSSVLYVLKADITN